MPEDGCCYRTKDMPFDFECTGCKLGFSVGEYHSHSLESDFIRRVLLVCTGCGLQHAVGFPLKNGKRFTHESLPHPLTDCRKLDGLLLPDDQWGHRILIDDPMPERLHCHNCNQNGCITDNLNQGSRCPRCNEVLPDAIAFWVT